MMPYELKQGATVYRHGGDGTPGVVLEIVRKFHTRKARVRWQGGEEELLVAKQLRRNPPGSSPAAWGALGRPNHKE